MNDVPGFDPDALRTSDELEMMQNQADPAVAAELQQQAPIMEQQVAAGEKAGPPSPKAEEPEVTDVSYEDEIPDELKVAEEEMPAWRRAMEEEVAPPTESENAWALQNIVAAKDAKAPEDYNAMDDLIEGIDAISQGTMRGVHSVITAPERMKDMLDGSYDRQMEEKGYYEPTGTYNLIPGMEWVGEQAGNEDLVKSQWGQMVSEVAKTAVIGGSVYVSGGAAGIPMMTTGGVIGTATLEGILDEDNAARETLTSSVVKAAPFLSTTPQALLMANGENDNGLIRTLRNTLEGIGMAGVGDVIARAFGQRLKNAGRSRLKQISDKAQQQIDTDNLKKAVDPSYEVNFEGYKNKPVADPWQGNATSEGSITERLSQAKQKAAEPRGSTATSISPSEVTTVVKNGKTINFTLDKQVKELLGEDGIAKVIRDNPNADYGEMFKYAYERQQAVLNRNLDGLSTEEFWAPLTMSNVDGLEAWSMKNIVAADLVNAELFSQVRDAAVGIREIADFADVMDVDGPMKNLLDRLKMGLANVERSRALWKAVQSGTVEAFEKNADDIAAQAMESVSFRIDAITKAINSGATDDQVRAFAEVVSGLDDIHSFGDLDEYFKYKLKNGKDGAIFNELGGVYVNSVLSGPRTPLKAILGTSAAAYIDAAEGIVGASMPALFGNKAAQRTLRASIGGINAMNQTLGEAFTIFKRNLGAYLKQDVATINSRFPMKSVQKQQWEAFGAWIKTSDQASLGDKAAYAIMNAGYQLNNTSLFTYANSVMTASDDGWRPLMARQRARVKAWRAALDDEANDYLTDSIEEVMFRYDKRFYDELLDSNGRIDFSKDAVLESMYQRATLTEPLQGFNKDLDEVMGAYPYTRPFYMFARTSVNDLRYNVRKIPLVSALLDQERAIAMASADNLDGVLKYGINNAADLEQAKFMQAGRIAMGTMVTFGGVQAYQQGRLSGDGPVDPAIRQVWIDSGWEPNRISVPTPMGNVSLDLEQLGGFGLLLRNIANVGDNMELMGEKWGENMFATIGHSIAATATNKLAMANLADFADLFNKPEKFLERTAGNFMNNQVPLAGLRNELGKVLSPYQAEIDSGITDSIRNRNRASEYLAPEDKRLPPKWDLLEYRPLKSWNFWQRALDAVNPAGIRVDEAKSPGRKLINNSNYDLSIKFYRYKGVDMSEDKYARSTFNEAFSKQNVVKKLDILAERPDVQASVAQMNRDARSPQRGQIDPMNYLHNQLIKQEMDKAKNKAWASIQADPKIQALKQEQLDAAKLNRNVRQTSSGLLPQAEKVLEQTPYK